jgi:ribosomal protein S18 acetylase RimI-like enzyme
MPTPRTECHLDNLTIRPMLESEVEAVVEIHIATFPGFFLSFLGRDFLALLYRSIRAAPEGVVLVATGEEGIQGFAAGVTSQESFYRRLVRTQWWRFAMSALGAAIRRPSVIPRLLRALRRSSEAKQSAAAAALMSIGVRPESEGKGIGSLIIESFCREMATRGVTEVCLTTDRDDNVRAKRFYERHGFHVSNSFVTREGRAMFEYARTLRGKDLGS